MELGLPTSNGNAAFSGQQNNSISSRTHVAAAAAGHARAATFQEDIMYDLSLERTIVCCGQGQLHVVNALIKADVDDCTGNTTKITDSRKTSFRRNDLSSTGSNSSSIPSNEKNLFSYSCLMSVSPVISDTLDSADTAVVTDNQDMRHSQSASSNHNNTRINNSAPIAKRRKHHYFSDHHHRMNKHHHRGKIGKNVTHYVIQLESIEDKKRPCTRESFSSATTSTTVQAIKLGITKEELRMQKQLANQLQVSIHNENVSENIEQPPENANRTDESTLASSSSDQIVATCG